jgi:SAM-dependent methyltransferase
VANDDWFAQYYGERYADSVRPMLTEERSDAEVAFILRETGLRPPARVLDLACGFGRHALPFARRGYAVTGVDRNGEWIAQAQQAAAGLDATFVEGDMREPFGGPYDLLASLFHSFGFFSDAENEAMLAGWSARLRDSGWLSMDIWNRDSMLRQWQPIHEWEPSVALRVREERAFDPLSGRLAIHYTYTYADGAASYVYDASFRLYAFTELRDLLARCGLTVVQTYGSLAGDPFSLDARRLVVFARKGA